MTHYLSLAERRMVLAPPAKLNAQRFTKPWKHGLSSEYVVAESPARLDGSKQGYLEIQK